MSFIHKVSIPEYRKKLNDRKHSGLPNAISFSRIPDYTILDIFSTDQYTDTFIYSYDFACLITQKREHIFKIASRICE